jgi:hypothetical protein
MLYFAYASHLDPDQMRRDCPGHRVVGMAALADHRIAFPRYSRDWGGGIAGLATAHGAKVWGVLHELSDADVAALDEHECLRAGCDRHNLHDRELVTVDLVRPDDGSVPRRVRALAYVARASNPSPPARRYLETLVRGARHHRLPDEYVEALAATPCAPEVTEPAP